ncbi:MAG TPA: glycosyltransferase family 2 protein [Gemmatimonadales bacterium]
MPGRAEPPLGREVAVVVPAYHVAATIRDVVVRIRRAVPDANVYVVDDGSTDGTGAAAREQGAVVLVHRHNHGKGAALRTGIERALADGARVIVTIDGDGQHPPEEIPRLVAPVRGGEADLVLGARSRSGTMPLGRRCTNWLSAALASRVGGVRVPDAQTGFRAIARSPAEAIRPAEHGYDFETAFLLAALAQGVRVRSVRVPTLYQGQESHFRGWADTWRQVRVFTRYGRQIIFGAR